MVQFAPPQQQRALGPPAGWTADERAARRTLRAQIARIERELAAVVIEAVALGGGAAHAAVPSPAAGRPLTPHLLSLGELEAVRDALSGRVASIRAALSARADEIETNRVLLERMRLEPGRYRWRWVSLVDVGEHGCGAYHVRPRLGVIGMLMDWWQVKLSSGCP